MRLNWIHTPGSDLFLVLNTSYSVGEGARLFREEDLIQRVAVAKLTYLVRLKGRAKVEWRVLKPCSLDERR